MNRILVIFCMLSMQAMAQELIIGNPVKFLALGDSYTIGESVPLHNCWPKQLADSLQQRGIDCLEPKIIAATGWRTDNLRSAITKTKFKQKYNLVSLLIGVNNLYQDRSIELYAAEFEALLNTAIRLAGDNQSQVFVLSIPDYGYTPFGKDNQAKISTGIDAFNAVNESIAKKLGVKYYAITEISRKGLVEPDLVASDGLHPSGKMYAAWVEKILGDAKVAPAKKD